MLPKKKINQNSILDILVLADNLVSQNWILIVLIQVTFLFLQEIAFGPGIKLSLMCYFSTP